MRAIYIYLIISVFVGLLPQIALAEDYTGKLSLDYYTANGESLRVSGFKPFTVKTKKIKNNLTVRLFNLSLNLRSQRQNAFYGTKRFTYPTDTTCRGEAIMQLSLKRDKAKIVYKEKGDCRDGRTSEYRYSGNLRKSR